MPVRIDPTLEPAPGGPPPGRLGAAEPPVVRAGVAASLPFLLEGERVSVMGDERVGEHAVWVGGTAVLSALTTDGGSAVNVVAAPGTLRRELLGGTTTLLEHTLAAPVLPLAAVQWDAPPGGRRPEELGVAFAVLPHRTEVRYRVVGSALVARSDDPHPVHVQVRLHPEPHEWAVVEGPGGGLGVRARLAGAGPVTLVVAAGDAEQARRALAAAPHLGAQEISAAAEADPANLELLCTRTGVADLDHGVVWAGARLRAALRRPATLGGDDAFWCGMGALALGDPGAARGALDTLHGRDEAVPWALAGEAPAAALATLLAARLTLLTDEAAPARRALERLLPDGLPAVAAGGADGSGVWPLALTSLADALRNAATPDEIQLLREAAARPASGRALRLPMVGERPQPVAGGLLRSLLTGVGGPPPDLPADTTLGAWQRWAAGDPDEAWAGWRGLLGRAFLGPPYGRGCWDPVTRPPGPAPEAARLLCGLAWGLLGMVPDAPSGRLRLAPALPAHLTAFEARGLRVGEFRFTLRMTREGRRHRMEMEPTHGRVPPVLVLEPSFPCGSVSEVRVDGDPAELDVEPQGRRTRVRVQIPLDGVRSLEVTEGE